MGISRLRRYFMTTSISCLPVAKNSSISHLWWRFSGSVQMDHKGSSCARLSQFLCSFFREVIELRFLAISSKAPRPQITAKAARKIAEHLTLRRPDRVQAWWPSHREQRRRQYDPEASQWLPILTLPTSTQLPPTPDSKACRSTRF